MLAVKGDCMLNYEEFEKLDKLGKTIAQTIAVFIGVAVIYFLVELLGFGDWIRRNSIWLIIFAVITLGVFINNLSDSVIAVIKRNSSNDKDMLLDKIKDLELDIDYIKNSIKD